MSLPGSSGASAAPVWGVALLLGLTACSEGCAKHELPVSQPEFEDQCMSVEELEELLWPTSEETERWRPLPEPQLMALERLVTLLLDRARRGGLLRKGERARAARWAKLAGLELRQIVVASEDRGEGEALWVLVEPPDDRRGRGAYLIRLGELEPAGEPAAEVELLLEAPHSYFDKYTGAVALDLFLENDAGRRPRALFVNSLHRYAQEDGERGKRGGDNPADACHDQDHPLARSTARALARLDLAVMQLHGFARDASAGDPELIISAGSVRPSLASAALFERLRAGFPELAVSHYGLDTDRLGATKNVQGWAARASGRCFVHIEASEAVRERLRDEREARRRFAVALFDISPEELARGCE